MDQTLKLTHERVDDLPLLFELIDKLGIGPLVERHLGTHGSQKGLANGLLCIGWLLFILSQGDHRKYSVQDWAQRHDRVLSHLLGQALRPVDFSDDRLGNLLRRFSDDQAFEALEADLWQQSVSVYQIDGQWVRLDASTASGFHQIANGQLMQRGHSSARRNDLPQLKLMLAATQPVAIPVAANIVAGNRSDAPLYVPLLERLRAILQRPGMLYVGDSKMSSLATRTNIVTHGDFYLMPLPESPQHAVWIERALGEPLLSIMRENVVIAEGCEFTRRVTSEDKQLIWDERVELLRSHERVEKQWRSLQKRLATATDALVALTPPPKQGRRQFRDASALDQAISTLLDQHKVAGLLSVTTSVEPAGRDRAGSTERLVITAVERNTEAIEKLRQRMGWYIQLTNLSDEQMSLEQSVNRYRDGWSLERNFHLLKDQPLGIAPLYVHRDDQIIGLTRLLLLGLRVLTLLELQLRQSLGEADQTMAGLYPGLPTKATARPTAQAVLATIARMDLTVSTVEIGQQRHRQLTPLPALLLNILTYLKLDPKIYRALASDSS